MINDLLIYEFADLRFSSFNSILENTANGKKIKLTQTHCHFLLAVIQKSPEIIEYDELRQKVWVQYAEMSKSLRHLIQATKRDFVKLLKYEDFPSDFIESQPKKGYRLNAPVVQISEENTTRDNFDSAEDFPIFAENSAFQDSSQISREMSAPKNPHFIFTTIAALFYGLLFWLALLLETAYQFDRYGKTALWLGLPLIVWNGGIMFAALNQKFRQNRHSFWLGAGLLVCGAVLSCLAVSFFLPNAPVTAARFQSQPAFAAYLKNALIYFLPLGVIFILIPFHFICVQQNLVSNLNKNDLFFWNKGAINLRPLHLFGLWLLAVMYAIFPTFYLLDNLLVGQYHSLFVTLAFLRFFVYFSLGLACLLWYKSQRLTNEV